MNMDLSKIKIEFIKNGLWKMRIREGETLYFTSYIFTVHGSLKLYREEMKIFNLDLKSYSKLDIDRLERRFQLHEVEEN